MNRFIFRSLFGVALCLVTQGCLFEQSKVASCGDSDSNGRIPMGAPMSVGANGSTEADGTYTYIGDNTDRNDASDAPDAVCDTDDDVPPLDLGPLGTPIFRHAGTSDKVESLPFTPDAMSLAVSTRKKIGNKQSWLNRFAINLNSGEMKISGQVTPYFEPGARPGDAVSINMEDIQQCEFNESLSTGDLASLRQLLNNLKVCRPQLNPNEPMPAIAMSPETAELILTKGQERLYLSASKVYLSQYPDAKSLCEEARELENFFVQQISDARFSRCVEVAK